jgi:hypothetical protein
MREHAQASPRQRNVIEFQPVSRQYPRNCRHRTAGLLGRPEPASQTLNALRAFFLWLAGRPGYRSRISYSDADYFRLSEKDTRIALSVRFYRMTA